MTVSTTTNFNEAAAGATVYYFTFRADSADWVQVYVDEVLQGTNFVLALNADQAASPGGSVTLPVAATGAVRIQRSTPMTQEVAYAAYDAFPAETHEAALDKVSMALQDATALEAATRAAADLAEATARAAADAAINANLQAEIAARAHAIQELIDAGVEVASTSSSFVKATGATTSRTLADHAADALNIIDFGAACDGVIDDTAAVQAAVNYAFSSGSGKVLIPGPKCKLGALTYPAWYRRPLVIYAYGRVYLTDTLSLPDNVHFIGLGGGATVQFQTGEVVEIIPHSDPDKPQIWMTGQSGGVLKNVAINGAPGIGVKCGRWDEISALYWLENVGVTWDVGNAASVPLVVDTAFWVWFTRCQFLGGAGTAVDSPCMELDAWSQKQSQYTTATRVYTLSFTPKAGTTTLFNLWLTNGIYGGGRRLFHGTDYTISGNTVTLTFDPAHGGSPGVYLVVWEQSGGYTGNVYATDLITAGGAIRIKGQSPSGYAGNFSFKNWIHEGGVEAMMVLDADHRLFGLLLDNIDNADGGSTVLDVKNPGVYEVTINTTRNQYRYLGDGQKINGTLTLNSPRSTTWGEPWRVGAQTNLVMKVEGETVQKLNKHEHAPAVVPFETISMLQNGTGYFDGSHATVTTGKTAPDGSSTAYEVAFAGGDESFVGDGAETVFTFTFAATAGNVRAKFGDFLANPQPTIALNADQGTNPGGTATFATAPADGEDILIYGTDATQGYHTVEVALGSTFSVGDRLIFGVWQKSAVGKAVVKPVGYIGNAGPAAGSFVGGSEAALSANGLEECSGLGWIFLTSKAEIATVGADFAYVAFRTEAQAGNPQLVWKPVVFKIPAASTLTDAELEHFIRYQMSGGPAGVPSGGGALALHSHQKLYFGKDAYVGATANGGLDVKGHSIDYGTAAPSTGTWAAGDRRFHSTPSVGQPKGWICTVAGTPGTWVSEGNL